MFEKENLHTRHDHIVLQTLTVVQWNSYGCTDWNWAHLSWSVVQVVVMQGRIIPNPQDVQGPVEREEPVVLFFFICKYTHAKGHLTSKSHQNVAVDSLSPSV